MERHHQKRLRRRRPARLNWAVRQGLIDDNPVAHIEKPGP